MIVGWNLGNTLDATDSNTNYGAGTETYWGMPKTTQAMIKAVSAAGFKTIRIPVSWHNHVSTDGKYTINSEWMARVKEIVDWAIENDMYVILNCHHDNYNTPAKMPKGHGYYPNKVNFAESAIFVYNLWSQIAIAFTRYMLIAIEQRESEDYRSCGELFMLFYQELQDITFIKALALIVELLKEGMVKLLGVTEAQIQSVVDYVVSALPGYLQRSLSAANSLAQAE